MKTLYACTVDWRYEIGEACDLEGNMPLYSSIEELKEARTCWEGCGIVELKLEFVKQIEPEQLFKKFKDKSDGNV